MKAARPGAGSVPGVGGRMPHGLVMDPALPVPGEVGCWRRLARRCRWMMSAESGERCLAPLPRVTWPLVNHFPSLCMSFAFCNVGLGGFTSVHLSHSSRRGTQHQYRWAMRYGPCLPPAQLACPTGCSWALRCVAMVQAWRAELLLVTRAIGVR